MLSSKGSSQLRSNQCFLHCRQILYHWAIREASLRCICLFKLFFLFSLDIHPKVDLLNHMIMLFSVFWKNSILFFIKPITIYISKRLFFLHLLKDIYYLLSFWWFFSDKSKLISHFILIYTSLMMSDVEHLFMSTSISSLEKKCLLASPANIWKIVLLASLILS